MKNKVIIFGLIIIFLTNPFSSLFYDGLKDNKHSELIYDKETDDVLKTNNDFIPEFKQIIGDYPNGTMNNGFNNSLNVATRTITNFSVNNTDYLFVGTVNSKNIPIKSIKISFPFFSILTLFLSIPLCILLNILFSKQIILNVITKTIFQIYKNAPSEGCELWYTKDTKNWKKSVGKNNSLINGGFGNINNKEITILIPFKTQSNDKYLYAGTCNPNEGCEIWRAKDPINGIWEPLIFNGGNCETTNGFGNPNNIAAFSASIMDGWLYIGTMNFIDGCEIWRTNGSKWERVIGGGQSISNLSYGFGDDNEGFERDIYAWNMKTFNISGEQYLYLGTFNLAGCELWRTNNGIYWECLVGETGLLNRGFNNRSSKLKTHNYGARSMELFNDALYIGTASSPTFKFEFENLDYPQIIMNLLDREFNFGNGGEIWKFNGKNIIPVIAEGYEHNRSSGFGDSRNSYIWSLNKFKTYLLAGTLNCLIDYKINISKKTVFSYIINGYITLDNSSTGCQLWYTEDGENWFQIVGNNTNFKDNNFLPGGFGDKNNIGLRAMYFFNNSIYLGTINPIDGLELWSIS